MGTAARKFLYTVNSTSTGMTALRTLKKETKWNTKLNGTIARESMQLRHATVSRQVAVVAAGESLWYVARLIHDMCLLFQWTLSLSRLAVSAMLSCIVRAIAYGVVAHHIT